MIALSISFLDSTSMEWLNYHHLYYFWVVCKEGGFSKAAAKLRISQSAISLQISKLETHLGEKLMVRGPRVFKLTEAGQVTLSQAEEIFRQGNDLLQYFRSGKMKSSFRVGALGGLSKNLQLQILSSVLSNPAIELSLEVGDPQGLVERLMSYKLDAVLSDVPLNTSAGMSLLQTEVAREVVCLVRRRKPKKTDNAELSAFVSAGIYLPAHSSPVTSAVLDYLSTENKKPLVRGFIDDIAFLRLLALQTDALIAIPKIGVRHELESGSLHIIHEFRKIRQSYFLVYRKEGARHPMLTQLLESIYF